MLRPDVARKRLHREQEITHARALPADLLFKQSGEIVWHRGPALRVRVQYRAVAFEKNLVSQEAVLAIIDFDAEPVSLPHSRFQLEKEFAANRKHATADADDRPRPVFQNLHEPEVGVINEGLNGSDHVLIGVANSNSSAHCPDLFVREAGHEFADGVRMKDAI